MKLKFTVVEHEHAYTAKCKFGYFTKSVNAKSHSLALQSLFTELTTLYLDLLCIPVALLSVEGEAVREDLEPFCKQKAS